MRRFLCLTSLVAVLLMAASCGVTRKVVVEEDKSPVSVDTTSAIVAKPECRTPDYLKPGDKIAIIAPAYTTPMENVIGAAEIIRSWGYEPVIGSKVDKLYAGKYAGTADERASDLVWALENPDIKAIICTRGGYGTIHLIERLHPELFANNPKWIVGYSDITTLLEMATCAGVAGIHGTMGNTIAKGGEDVTCRTLKNLLEGSVPQYEIPAHPQNIKGTATGILVGGNICTFAPNIGTWADSSSLDDLILFIEEVGESMHNVDRQFNILRANGVLDRCKGVILGQFTDCDSEFDFGSVEAMLKTYLKDYNIPVLCGFPAGHDSPNLPLVMGARTTIDVRGDGATVRFEIPGRQTLLDLR